MLDQLAQGLHISGLPQEHVWITLVWFFLSTLTLDLFDISLPRGDSIGVSGAITSAALVILGPAYATVACVGPALLAHAVRRGAQEPRRLATMIVARLSGLLAGTLALRVLGVEGPVWYRYFIAAAIPAIFLLSELTASQTVTAISTRRPLGRLIIGNLVVQTPLLLAEWSAAVLLLIAFDGMGSWSLVPVVALLLLIRQSYALLLEIRETYRTTVEVLVEAAESQDCRLEGHAERSAEIARRIAARVGLTASQVEIVSYAALLHDVDAALGDSPSTRPMDLGHSAAMFEGSDFFADIVPVLRICDGDCEAANVAAERDLASAMIVAIASDADVAEHEALAGLLRRPAVSRVAPWVSPTIKARVVGAALELGYKIPAVS